MANDDRFLMKLFAAEVGRCHERRPLFGRQGKCLDSANDRIAWPPMDLKKTDLALLEGDAVVEFLGFSDGLDVMALVSAISTKVQSFRHCMMSTTCEDLLYSPKP
jgi:hypothetical protein